MGNECTEGHQGQVSGQLKRLEDSVEKLVSIVKQIESRLCPVLRVVDEDNTKPGVEEGLVPLAELLDTLAVRVENQLRRLDAILARIEL